MHKARESEHSEESDIRLTEVEHSLKEPCSKREHLGFLIPRLWLGI